MSTIKSPPETKSSPVIAASIVLATAGLIVVFRMYSDLPREAIFMGGIFLLAALLWVTEAIPL